MPKLSFEQVSTVAGWVATYVAEQRDAFRGRAQPIAPAQLKAMNPFFPNDVLSSTRVIRGRPGEPAFYAQLRALGIRNAPSFSTWPESRFRMWSCTLRRSPRRCFSMNWFTRCNTNILACGALRIVMSGDSCRVARTRRYRSRSRHTSWKADSQPILGQRSRWKTTSRTESD